tara:strand:- start:6028 stop:6792 length:765 start_codon:yes stop_codon:yes gene_type:complete
MENKLFSVHQFLCYNRTMSDHYEFPYPSKELESRHPFSVYEHERLSEEVMEAKAKDFYHKMDARRSVRMFSPDPVPQKLIELAIQAASTAPSGAHKQPWTFVATNDPEIKREIRAAAEEEEEKNYLENRMNEEWQEALAPLGTDHHKEFLQVAPWIIVLFEQRYETLSDGTTLKNYYVKESVGIAAGMFITALHHMGLATLTHTPTPMKFLNTILGRPKNERPFVLFPVGYPLEGVKVPDLNRKELNEIFTTVF